MGDVTDSGGRLSADGPRPESSRRRLEWRSGLYRRNLAVAESRHLLRPAGRFVAVSCLLLAASSVLLMVTPGGPTTTAAKIATTTVAVAAAVAGGLWWFRGFPRDRGSYAFVFAAELGHSVVLLSCADPVVSLLGATWFFLIGDYITFAHGRRALVIHCVWVKINLLFYGIRALLEPQSDVPFVVFLVIALTATLIVTRLFGQVFTDALRSDSERSVELAHRDPMTQLLNRRGLEVQAARVFGPSVADGSIIAVFLIDVDRFKAVNDVHGHLAGDRVLQLLAERLHSSVRKFGLVARTGGEEFVVLDRVHADGIQSMAERLRAVCAEATDEIPITVSIGAVGLAADDFAATDPQVLLTNMIILADSAMYAAKQRGGNQVVLDLPRGLATAAQTGTDQIPLPPTPGEIFDNVMATRSSGQRHPAG